MFLDLLPDILQGDKGVLSILMFEKLFQGAKMSFRKFNSFINFHVLM